MELENSDFLRLKRRAEVACLISKDMNTHSTCRSLLLLTLLSALSSRAVAGDLVVRASSGEGDFHPRHAADGNRSTRWGSEFSDPQWLIIDYGEEKEIVGLILHWELAFAYAYDILVSSDGEEWKTVYSTGKGDGGVDDIDFEVTRCRYLKVLCRNRGTQWGYSLFEVIPKTMDCPWGEGEPSDFFLRKIWDFKTDDVDFDLESAPPCSTGEWSPIRTHASWDSQGPR